MRVVMFLIVGQLVLSKIILTIKTGVMQPWTTEEIGVLGVTLGTKAWQRSTEQPVPAAPPVSTSPPVTPPPAA